MAVFCPLDERDLAYEHRLNPVSFLNHICGWSDGVRATRLLDGAKSTAHLGQIVRRETFAGAHFAGIDELIVVEVPKQQRPDARARSFRIAEAANHELATLNALRFQPTLAAPATVAIVSTLRDDSLATEPTRMLHDSRTVTLEMPRILDQPGSVADQFLESRLTLLER